MTDRAYRIDGAPNLDPIYIYTTDFSPGSGRITIACWTQAWTASWGAMSGRDVAAFFCACDDGYLLSALTHYPRGRRATKSEEVYLVRIIQAVRDHLRVTATKEPPAC